MSTWQLSVRISEGPVVAQEFPTRGLLEEYVLRVLAQHPENFFGASVLASLYCAELFELNSRPGVTFGEVWELLAKYASECGAHLEYRFVVDTLSK